MRDLHKPVQITKINQENLWESKLAGFSKRRERIGKSWQRPVVLGVGRFDLSSSWTVMFSTPQRATVGCLLSECSTVTLKWMFSSPEKSWIELFWFFFVFVKFEVRFFSSGASMGSERVCGIFLADRGDDSNRCRTAPASEFFLAPVPLLSVDNDTPQSTARLQAQNGHCNWYTETSSVGLGHSDDLRDLCDLRQSEQ